MRKPLVLFVFLAGCAQREAPPAASPSGGAGSDAPQAFEQPLPSAPPPPQESAPAPTGEEAGRVHSGQDPTTPEEALRIIETEAANLDAAFSADALTGSCDRVCRALGSMRRAVASLCELTDEDDQRCTSARDRLEKNEARVGQAGCGC